MPDEIQLDSTQHKELRQALLSAFPTFESFEQMVFDQTGNNFDEFVPNNADLRGAVFSVIKEAQAWGWLGRLIEGAHQENPTNRKMRHFIKMHFSELLVAIAEDNEGAADPLNANFLNEDRSMLFVDRLQLRKGLRELTGSGRTPRILAVHSDLEKCGKTYTKEFIQFVALRKEHRVAYIDIGEEIEFGSGLQDLVEQLARKLRADLSDLPPKESQTARWIRNLVHWLLDQINRTDLFWWLVLDSINQVEVLPKEIHDFIQRLALELDEEFDPPCRLILLSYQGKEQLPIEIRSRVVQDEIIEKPRPEQMRDLFAMQIRQLLGEDAEDDEVQEMVDMLTDLLKSKLAPLPEIERPFVMSSLVRDVLQELEASLVEEEGTPA
ncbi:MAG: effector-associated domain EAD1-containing protein [Chloroflexota bacterium]